jgi:glycosyltransferase involved in cell wall biosynthesis
MKKVAIYTTFTGYDQAYSLCLIARLQLKALAKAGYKPRFILREGSDPSVYQQYTDDIMFIPNYICENDGSDRPVCKRTEKTYGALVEDTYQETLKSLEGVEVVITHDLVYQASNRIQEDACFRVATDRPDIRWLHWIHSATTPGMLNKNISKKMPNSFLVYPNRFDVPRVAHNFGVELNEVKVVPHPTDVLEFFGVHPMTEKLVEERRLLEADVIGIYPLRLDRGKQPHIVIEVFDKFRSLRRSHRLVIMDFHSTGGDKVTYREEMKKKAATLGWTSQELTFISEFDESLRYSSPQQMVRDLFLLSNVYIHPSRSETYSLVTQEARLCGNLLVLNDDFPPMRSIYGDKPIYRKFSSTIDITTGMDGETNTTYGDRDAYMTDIARCICYYLENDPVLSMRTETRRDRNLMAVFTRDLEPLIYLDSDVVI